MTADDHPLPRAWLTVALLWVVAGLDFLDRTAFTTMHQSLVTSIPMSETQFGLQTSAFFWVYGVLSPFAGYLADRFSRSRVIILSLFAWSAVTLLTAYATTFQEVLTTRILLGISQTCYYPAALALIADYHRTSTRSLATGIHVTGLTLGGAAAGLGGWMAERHGWNVVFVMLGLAGIVYCGILLFALRDAPREHDVTPQVSPSLEPARFGPAIASLFRSKSFLLAFFFWGVMGIVMGVVVGWMPTYLQEHFGLRQGQAGVTATTCLQLSALGGVLIGGAWADRWSRTEKRARILVPALGLCVAAPAMLLVAHSGILLWAVVGLVLYGCTRAFTDSNLMPILCMVVDPRYRATAYGFLNLFAFLLSGLAIYAGGALRDARVDLSAIFQFSAGTLVLCGIFLFFIKPRPAI